MISDQDHVTRVESNANLILATLQANPEVSDHLYKHLIENVPGFPKITPSSYSRYMRILHRAGWLKKVKLPGSNKIRYTVINTEQYRQSEGGSRFAAKVRF